MWLYLPLVLSILFGVSAPTLARRLPPSAATWLLSAGGLLAAAGSSSALALLAFDVVARNPAVATRGGWSREVLRRHDPVSLPAGMLAGLAVVVFALRFVHVALRRVAAMSAAHRLAAGLPQTGSELSVLRSDRRQAFAVPGRPGRIAVTTALLRSLDAEQRRAVLAHERSHLEHHHHAHHTAVQLAVAVNPLLRRLHAAVQLATERWADEDAARVCRRSTVADALQTAATGSPMRTPAVVLAAATLQVAARIDALRAPALRMTAWRVTVPAAVLIAIAAAVALALHDTERLFETAQHAYRPHQN